MNTPATIAAPVVLGPTLATMANPDTEIYRLAKQADAAEAEYRRLDAIQGEMEDAGDLKGGAKYEKEVTDPAWDAWQDLCDAVRDAPVSTIAAVLLKLRRMQAESCYDRENVAPFVMRTVESVIADLERMASADPVKFPDLLMSTEAKAFLRARAENLQALAAYDQDDSAWPAVEESLGEVNRTTVTLFDAKPATSMTLAVKLDALAQSIEEDGALSENPVAAIRKLAEEAMALAGRPAA